LPAGGLLSRPSSMVVVVESSSSVALMGLPS
jgi:hypothetical protein